MNFYTAFAYGFYILGSISFVIGSLIGLGQALGYLK